MNDASMMSTIPPQLLLVLAGHKKGWSPAFVRLAQPTSVSFRHSLEKVVERLEKATEDATQVYENLSIGSKRLFIGWFPALDSIAATSVSVTRSYLLCTPITAELNSLVDFWYSKQSNVDALGSQDSVLNEQMGVLLGYPVPWRPSRTFAAPKPGEREFQAFIKIESDRLSFMEDLLEDLESVERETLVVDDDELIESFGFLAEEKEAVELEIEKRQVPYGGFLEQLGLGTVETELVDLRR